MKATTSAARAGASRVLEAHYRLPEGVIEVDVLGERRAEPTFFKFGDATCYGRPVKSAGDLSKAVDLASQVTHEDGVVRLPFDLNEIIDNLHYERYTDQHAAQNGSIVRALYYTVRPLLPVQVRKYLQRMWLRDWDKIPFPRWPLDMTVETVMEQALMHAIKASGRTTMPFIWFWPDGAPSCAMMTHDVETGTGLDFCDQLMDLNDSFGIKASFQLVPEGRYHVSQHVLDRLRSRDFETNVHDFNHDGHLFQSRDQFLARAAKINEYARQFQALGFRAGAMYRRQDWFDAFELSYDMSVPNAAHLEPQRGGCCTVMPYFIGRLLELPLTTIQDYSLFHIADDYSTRLWKEQIARISARHGLISFITHPDYLIEDRARRVYAELLAHLRELRESGEFWFALPRDVNQWWRDRSLMRLVESNGRWRIEGPDSHRARVALATIENGRLVYKVSRTSEELEYSRC